MPVSRSIRLPGEKILIKDARICPEKLKKGLEKSDSVEITYDLCLIDRYGSAISRGQETKSGKQGPSNMVVEETRAAMVIA